MKNKIYAEFRLVKNDLLKINNNYESDIKYHYWLLSFREIQQSLGKNLDFSNRIKFHKSHIIRKNIFKKDSVPYDLCCNPQDYLKSMFYINKELELLNEKNINPKDKQIKLYQVIHQRKNIIPKYITIDTYTLITLVLRNNFKKYTAKVEKYQNDFWKDNFKTNLKEFKKKNYKFSYMIKTDGISCSILFIRLKTDGKPIKINAIMNSKSKKIKNVISILKRQLLLMRTKTIITIDPNYSDIIYCLSKTNPYKETKNVNGKIKIKKQDENLTFRYTQNQRRLETRNKKYNKIVDKIKKDVKINNKNIKELELEISKYNSKTSNYNKLIDYYKKKNEINGILFEFYINNLHRKLKFNRYINTQKSESKMIKNFGEKYGDPEKCLIIMGDYDKKENMRGIEPIICKKIRKIFRKHKYEVFMINEFRTSKLCHKCCGECEPFLKRESHKPKDINKETEKGKIITVNGLLRCNNDNCKLIHNRDKNACLNMYKIVENIFNAKGRPKEYCRAS